SRGPTADGRGKPEIVAQGVNTIWAVAANATQVTGVDGTSLATPLIGGAAAQVREAHPEWTVQQLRYALKVTADKAGAPDSTTYGWYVSASDPASHGRESRERFTFVTSSTTGVVLSPPASGVVLYPNRPNPVQSSTLIPFAIAASSPNGMTLVTLRIYDTAGPLVRKIGRASCRERV